MGDGKLQGASQLAADPVQGIETRTAAGVLTSHLADNHLGVGINMQGARLKRFCALQCLKQGDIFSYVVILAAYPAGDTDGSALRTLDHDANTGRPRVSQRATIYVGYEVIHPRFRCPLSVHFNMRQNAHQVKEFIVNACNTGFPLCNTLWKTGFGTTPKSISVVDSSNYNFRFAQDKNV
jgi:hypothetical protein